MSLFKKPGASLLLVGLALLIIVGPIGGAIPFVGGIISLAAFVLGGLGVIGGGYLLARSTLGPNDKRLNP